MPKKRGADTARRARAGLAATRLRNHSPSLIHGVIPTVDSLDTPEVVLERSQDDVIVISDSEDSTEDEIEELEGHELVNSLACEDLRQKNAYQRLMVNRNPRDWKHAELSLPKGAQTGQAPRTLRRHNQLEREKETFYLQMQNTEEAGGFREYFGCPEKPMSSPITDLPPIPSINGSPAPANLIALAKLIAAQEVAASNHAFATQKPSMRPVPVNDTTAVFPSTSSFTVLRQTLFTQSKPSMPCPTDTEPSVIDLALEGYISDDSDSDADEDKLSVPPCPTDTDLSLSSISSRKHPAPSSSVQKSVKKWKLDKPDLHSALSEISRHLASAKTKPHAGSEGLEARRARSIQAALHSMVHNGSDITHAARVAAEAAMFAPDWGSRLVRKWVHDWVENRILPTQSNRGRHSKINSVLSDPVAREAIRAYLRSHKWALNPHKLELLMKGELEAREAEGYVRELEHTEMPRGLKVFLEKTLLPRLHVKLARRYGLSLSSMRRLMLREGFTFMAHKKGLYFDGHERPDVVEDRQKRFLPTVQGLRSRFVQYEVGNVVKEILPDVSLGPPLVLVAHDEMTAQAHDGQKYSWVLNGEQPLRKKGAGHGIHQSDFICSTVGWLKEASVTIEYGKNHDGMWTGDLFCKQLIDKFFPVFAAAHPPGYVAAIFVDNPQGHSSYAADALRVSEMNVNPGGKQPHMRPGWFIHNGERQTQFMIFPHDHPTHANQPKGIKAVLQERGLWQDGKKMTGKCKSKCPDGATDCCGKRILELQPDFKEQRSRVQEIIESAGHICVMLPKYHCEINFIKYFWGAVKRWLREHCDYTFGTLKENMPKALHSVSVELIRKWEHRSWRFIDAYADNLDAKDALRKVKQFSSKKYKSHRRIPERLAQAMDEA